jgi:hypothetical protein
MIQQTVEREVIFFFWKLHLLPLNFDHSCKYSPTFKTSHLGVSKFDFLLLCPFQIENPNGMPILPLAPKLKPRRFGNGVVLESGVKLALRRIFCTKEESEGKPKFNTPK